MASWKLLDVPDSASEYVGGVLEAAGKVAEQNLQDAAKRINQIADTSTKVIVVQIGKALGG